MRRVLICGSRDFDNMQLISGMISQFDKDTVIIEGGASGADTIARQAAQAVGLKVIEFPADWNKYGKAAGPIRNQKMLDEGKPDVVYAFYKDRSKSRGTKHMVSIAKAKGITVLEYESIDRI